MLKEAEVKAALHAAADTIDGLLKEAAARDAVIEGMKKEARARALAKTMQERGFVSEDGLPTEDIQKMAGMDAVELDAYERVVNSFTSQTPIWDRVKQAGAETAGLPSSAAEAELNSWVYTGRKRD